MSELRDLDFERLSEILSSGSKEELYNFCIKFNLKIEDGKIYPTQRDECLDAIKYWDKKQLVTKINLNSLYGAILNPGCRFQDKRIGQSTTLTGRVIARHMDAHVNECITGEYDHVGSAIIYGDSVTGDTRIKTDSGEITISDLFNQCIDHSIIGNKEYGTQSMAKVVGFNAFEDSPIMSNISYVMRHKTKKKIYELEFENGRKVKVTEDHSVMVDRDGFLIEVRPTELLDSDLIISLIS